MLHGSNRTRFLLRLSVGVALVVLGIALHLLVAFTVGLLMLAMAGVQWFNGGGNSGSRW